MQSIMKKFVGFLIIGSICLLPVILSEIQAQQAATSQLLAAQSRANIIAELKSRRIAIKSMTDIDVSIKSDSLNYIDRAIAYLELADITDKITGSRHIEPMIKKPTNFFIILCILASQALMR